MSHPKLWPDLTPRYCDPHYYERSTLELLRILREVLVLNQTGACDAFFTYHAHVGVLEIVIYQGRWTIDKKTR